VGTDMQPVLLGPKTGEVKGLTRQPFARASLRVVVCEAPPAFEERSRLEGMRESPYGDCCEYC
jgi:hypothetical protein